jgi:hypothetical protein
MGALNKGKGRSNLCFSFNRCSQITSSSKDATGEANVAFVINKFICRLLVTPKATVALVFFLCTQVTNVKMQKGQMSSKG